MLPDQYPAPATAFHASGGWERRQNYIRVQCKWLEEVGASKTSEAKTASLKRVKSIATKDISYVMSKTKISNLSSVDRNLGPSPMRKIHTPMMG